MTSRRTGNATAAANRRRTRAEIQAWITTTLEEGLELAQGEIDVEETFDAYGLDSAEAVEFMSALEDWIGRELPVNLVYQYPSVAELARYLEVTG